MKKFLCVIFAAFAIMSSAAGITANSASYKEILYSMKDSLISDIESGCFTAFAIRHQFRDEDLTDFGYEVSKKPVPKNPVTAMKYALTVYVCGVTGSEYDDLDKDFLCSAQSTSGLVFGLHMINNGFDIGRSADDQIKLLLDRANENGGFPTVGETSDVDMTSMAIQALAPYKDEPEIKIAIEKALDFVSSQQTDSGAFKYFGSENCENCAQAIIALSSLGIDCKEDERFIKNGHSVYDALMSYQLDTNEFEHTMDSGANKTATSQAYCALSSMDNKTPFYVFDKVEKTKSVADFNKKTDNSLPLGTILVIVVCAAGVIICIIMLLLRKKRVIDYVIVIALTALVAILISVIGIKSSDEYFSYETDGKITAYITVSVDTTLIDGKEMIKKTTLGISDNETAYSALVKICKQNGLAVTNSGYYVYGIGNLYESEHGSTSGWAYKVNGITPSVGAGSYKLKDGDELLWIYVPNLSYLTDDGG